MIKQDLFEKTIIITGGNSGIGLEAAKMLVKRGARVVLAVRNEQKGKQAKKTILAENSDALVDVMKLDLSDLKSVKDFSEQFLARFENLHILINNAGVMVPPYQLTKDGFELQFGCNHLGHFALTGYLLPMLEKTPNSRVVTVSSIAHRGASIFFDNLDGAKGYKAMAFYKQSKLANLLFAQELDERLKERRISTISVACHPGISTTNLFKFGKRDAPPFLLKIAKLFLQSAEMGALPTVYAATNENLKGGEYIGPDGKGNRKGNPTIEVPAPEVYNKETMKKLWDVSEKLTGGNFHFGG
ncbi:short-chain dehydrogenase [Anaerobacillus arseniciselenatis]|uniref:Short-chain dehydrogenase n=1 Tax=Anaerobacillus arseniciselenatis TaxID=85682 RepID=A0A1S2LN35_9BACI|nr:oxidoreductase [Anaerobacillus arseniciselenatis]OIJ12835.1 short-chain dehydrogenase [Anaerobacillus arseniciselenatis]